MPSGSSRSQCSFWPAFGRRGMVMGLVIAVNVERLNDVRSKKLPIPARPHFDQGGQPCLEHVPVDFTRSLRA